MRRVAPVVVALVALAAAALAAPDATAATPRKVAVGVYVNNIFAVDIKASQFTVDFYVWFRWTGEDFKPLDSFELANGRITAKTGIVKKVIAGQNYASCRVLATITKFWDMRRYPLDNHTLTLEIEDVEHEALSLVFDPDVRNAKMSPELHVPGWLVTRAGGQVVPHTYHTNYGDVSLPSGNRSTYSRYIFAIEVRRPGWGRFLKVFFGLFIATLVSWCAFHVRPKESSPRVSLGVGATFAAAAVTVAINSTMPDTNAVTMADKLVWLTLGMIVLSVAETITALTLSARGREELQRRLDRWCGLLFPLGYVVLLALIVVS